MTTLTSQESIRNRKLTALFCTEISTSLIDQLKIKKPRFHVQKRVGLLHETPSWGETTIISNKPHVFISSTKCDTWSELLQTIAHELIHVWQFTSQTNCRGGVFNDEDCEIQAYALEPLATVALAASFLSAELKNANLASQETQAA